MLSLDLFDSRYEKKLHEGALDDTIVRTQAHLMEPLSQRAADIRTQIRSGKLTGADLDKLEKEYEDLVQKRLNIMLDRQPKNEQQVPSKQDPFAYVKPEPKGIGDIQDPRQKMAQLKQKAKTGPLANVGAGIKAFIKGEPEPLDEQELGRRGIGIRNMRALENTVTKGLARVEFQFGNGQKMFADEDDADKLADYYNGLDSATRSNFVYNVISDPVKFVALCKQLGIELVPVAAQQPDLPGIPGQGELRLSEKRNQKKKFKSTLAQREIEKAMAGEPAAGDPIEAFILQSLKTDNEQAQQIQDLETKIQTLRQPAPTLTTPTTTPAPSTTSTTGAAPSTTRTDKPAQPTVQTVAVPGTTAEPIPAPEPAKLPKKDQKILSRVKSIEKRLKDRVDAYQTDRVLRDKTPDQLSTMQQQIDNLRAQLQTQRDQLSRTARLTLGQDDVWDVEANIVRPAFSKIGQAEPVQEHGGGIGPRQHWQDLMQETVTDVRAGMAEIYRRLAPKIERHRDSFLAGQLYDELENYAELHGAEREFKQMMNGARNRAHMEYDTNPGGFHNWFWFLPFEDEQLLEGIRDTASATAVVACLLAGGSLSGCATAPQQTTTAQVIKTGQDLGRVVYNAKNITRAGTEEEVRQELKNIARGMSGRPQELNHSNILRIWRNLNKPAQPQEQFEAKQIKTRDDFAQERDRLLRMIGLETDPANKQILKSAIRQLENQAEQEGWLTIQQRMIREDTAALAAEDAILKRIFVRHKNLMMEYGPDKITQAAESVAYNVGDIAHITDEQINEWVGQVEYILGARP